MDPTVPLPRRLGRAVWWSLTAAVTVAGVAGAFLVLGAAGTLLLAGLAAAVTGFAVWLLRQSAEPGRPPRAVPVPVLLSGLWLLAFVGLTGELGAAGLGVCAALATAGALLFRRRPSRAARQAARPDEERAAPPGSPALERIPADRLPVPSGLGALSTAQVCWLWRVSYVRLQQPGSPRWVLEDLAELREACLDELERRDPGAFRRWLPTARAAGNPARVFCRQPQQG